MMFFSVSDIVYHIFAYQMKQLVSVNSDVIYCYIFTLASQFFGI